MTAKRGYTLSIRNFQAIRSMDIDLWGYTALTGPSDRGKSAIVRALNAVLHNDFHPSMITTGQQECMIQLTLHEHPVIRAILLHKNPDKGINTYTITKADGTVETNPKSGKTTPDSMREAGIRILTTERGQAINTNLHEQHEGTFLLNSTETQITDIFNALFGTNLIEAALLNVNRDAQATSKAHGEISLGIQQQEAVALQAAHNVAHWQSLLDASRANREAFQQADRLAGNVAEMQNSVNIIEARLAEADRLILDRQQRVAAIQTFLNAARQVETARTAASKITLLNHELATLEQEAHYASTQQIAVNQAARATSLLRQAKQAVADYQNLPPPPTPPPFVPEKLEKISALVQAIKYGFNARAAATALSKKTAEANATEEVVQKTEATKARLQEWYSSVVIPNTAKCDYCEKPIPRLTAICNPPDQM